MGTNYEVAIKLYSGTSIIRTYWGPTDLFELEKFSK